MFEVTRLLGTTAHWMEGWALRGWLHEQTGQYDRAETDYRTAWEIGKKALPKGFRGKLPWGDLDNRPFLGTMELLADVLERLMAAIDDTLSTEIVVPEDDGQGPADWPWRVIRRRQDAWDRGPFGEGADA